MHIDVSWVGDKQFEAINEESAKFRMDSKKKAGGSGDYASPTHYFTAIHIKYILAGGNIDRDKVEQAVSFSQDKYCSVRATLTDKCKVTTEIVIQP
jgi:uncharacterized OsmC-like protein